MTGFDYIYNEGEVNANMTILVRQRFFYPKGTNLKKNATQQSRSNE